MRRCMLIIFLIIIFQSVSFAGNNYPVQNGILDLRNYNWEKQGIVRISGYWDFYWNKFYTSKDLSDSSVHNHQYAFVPDFWNKYITTGKKQKGFGFATYHVKILCPASAQQLSLRLLTIQGAYKLFVNGEKISETGKADTTKALTIANLKPAVLNVEPSGNVLDIVIQVSNFNDKKGGLWDVVKLGTYQQIQSDTIKNLAFDFLMAGIFLLAFVYTLIQFLYFKTQYALLFFALICLIVFIRIMVTGQMPVNYVFNCNWETARRLEYISLYFSVAFMALFSYYLFPLDFSKNILLIILPVSLVFILTSIFGSYYNYTYIVEYYQGFMIAAALYGLSVYIRAFIKKRTGSTLFLSGFIIFLATIINDVLYANLIIRTIPLFYAGLALFAVTISIILSRQFSGVFVNLEITNKQLDETNKRLGVLNESIREKNNELDNINKELDIFVHRTSHDLRAPLSSVTGITELMKDETNVSILHSYTDLQKKTLQRMDKLIQDIIDFSKNKKLKLELEEVNFSTLINNAIEDLSHLKNADKVLIKIKIEQEEKFISDPRRINTVINNLISNALKYSDVSKPEPSIDIIVAVGNKAANIQICDNGIGVEESHLEKIFNIFYRATSNSVGTGLGLYIIKETIEKLDGHIDIKSKKGEGTLIKITLPDKSVSN